MLSSDKNTHPVMCVSDRQGAPSPSINSGVKLRQISVELKCAFWDFHCVTLVCFGVYPFR